MTCYNKKNVLLVKIYLEYILLDREATKNQQQNFYYYYYYYRYYYYLKN